MLLVLGDMVVITIAQLACFWARYYLPLLPPVAAPRYRYTLFLILTLAVAVLALAAAGAYRLPRRFRLYTTSATLLRALAAHIIIIILALYLLRLGTWRSERPFLYSRFVVGAGWASMFALLLAWRLAIGRLQRALFGRGWGTRRTVIVGVGSRARRLAAALQDQRWMGYDVLGLVGSPAEPGEHDQADETAAPAVLGELPELPGIVARLDVDVVWLALPAEQYLAVLPLILVTPIPRVKWAMVRQDLEHLLQAISTAPLPARMGARSDEDIVAQLVKRIEHHLEPLAGPKVTLVGSRGIPATYGGIERYVEELSTRLAERGYRVSVYCRPHYTSQRGSYQGVELRRLPCILTKHLEAISHTLLATLHLLFLEDEIVHYQALGPSLLTWVPRLLGRKTVVTVQGLDWQRRKWGPIARAVLKIGELASARVPHRTIVVSHDLERHYWDHHRKTVIYIPNGVNSVQRRAAHEIRELGLQEGNYVLSVGRLVPEKKYDMLISAFRQVKTDKRLVIAGGSSHTGEYVTHLHELAQGVPVLFTGYAYGHLLDELFSNAYLFVSASEIEGLPITLLEAMSFGTCALVSDIPPHVEVLAGLGYTFHTGDEEDLVTKLQTLLDQPEAVARTGKKLRRRAASAYSWELVTDATEQIYRELLQWR